MIENMDPDAPSKPPVAWVAPEIGAVSYPVNIPPIFEVLFPAFLLSEREEAPVIGFNHLLAALNAPLNKPTAVQPSGRFVPVPHKDKNLSPEAAAVIEAACALSGCDLEHLTKDSLRAALLASLRDRGT